MGIHEPEAQNFLENLRAINECLLTAEVHFAAGRMDEASEACRKGSDLLKAISVPEGLSDKQRRWSEEIVNNFKRLLKALT